MSTDKIMNGSDCRAHPTCRRDGIFFQHACACTYKSGFCPSVVVPSFRSSSTLQVVTYVFVLGIMGLSALDVCGRLEE